MSKPRPRPTSGGLNRRGQHSLQAAQLHEDSDPLVELRQVDPQTVTENSKLAEYARRAHELHVQHLVQATQAAALAGSFLLEVQARLAGTQNHFGQWCESQGIPRRTAYNHIKVCQKVAEDPSLLQKPVRQVLGHGNPVVLPRAPVEPNKLERFNEIAKSRGLKPSELLAQVVDDWLERNDGVIDV